MKDMKKDKKIESEFTAYFEGCETPPCDLEGAKRAAAQSHRAAGRGIFFKVASAFACFLLVCAVLLVGFLPDRANVSPAPSVPIQYYALSSAQAEGASYAQLSQKYGGAVDALSPFEWADNAQAYYTLYQLDGQEVLVGVRLKYLRGLLFWEGTLYIDLTGGERLPQELSSFSRLDPAGSVYGCQYFSDTRYENGEFVSDASISLSSYTYYMTVEGQDRSAVYFLLRLLARS